MSSKQIDPTALDDLIDLDTRSLIKLGDSVVVSIPSAADLGLVGNIDEIDACVSVRRVDDGEFVVTTRFSIDD